MTTEQQALATEFAKWKREQEAAWQEQIEDAERRAEKAEAECAAYKRAKAENDERYMIERDEARAECARRERVIDEIIYEKWVPSVIDRKDVEPIADAILSLVAEDRRELVLLAQNVRALKVGDEIPVTLLQQAAAALERGKP